MRMRILTMTLMRMLTLILVRMLTLILVRMLTMILVGEKEPLLSFLSHLPWSLCDLPVN